MHKYKNSLRIAIIVISSLIAILVSFLFILFLINKPKTDLEKGKTERDLNTVIIDSKKYLPKEDVLNVLIIGIDEEIFTPLDEGLIRNRAVADFISIVSINKIDKTYSITMINRDTITIVDILGLSGEMVSSKNMQIGLAHTYGSGDEQSINNLKNAVSKLLYGIKIDYYVRLTMNAIPIIIDDVNGIDVKIEGDLSAIDESWTDGKTVHLDSTNALNYVRARQEVTDGTNLKRMERQKTFIEGFVNKLNNSTYDLETLYNFVSGIPDECYKSNTSLYELRDLYGYFKDYEFKGFNNIEGSAYYNNLAYFNPDLNSIKKIVKEVFFDERID